MCQNSKIFIKSPLNYIGGKYKILDQIVPLFPKKINCFIDLFAGGGNVGINVNAKKVILNDNLVYLVDFYKTLQKKSEKSVFSHIYEQIQKFKLSATNEDGYKLLRKHYNKTKDPIDLFILISYSFNHQIRFNNEQEFNNPFGKNRSCYNNSIETNLRAFIQRIKDSNIQLYSQDFRKFDLSFLGEEDFVYCDPPYLITTGTYNDGKRGFTGWSEQEEIELLDRLNYLNQHNVKFALSNVLTHKGKTNKILQHWIKEHENLVVNKIHKDYLNSNYHSKKEDSFITTEVLITNYKPIYYNLFNGLSLFEGKDNEIYWEQAKFA